MPDGDLERAVDRVLKALDDRGREPVHHYFISIKHRNEWPVLHFALDNLRRVRGKTK